MKVKHTKVGEGHGKQTAEHNTADRSIHMIRLKRTLNAYNQQYAGEIWKSH